MLVTYRYKLKLASGQYARMVQLCEMQRQLYNAALEERIGAWSKAKLSVTRLDQQKSLTQIRQADPDGHGRTSSNLGRWTLKRVEDAMTGFFSRVKRGQKAGFPRFKGLHRWRSFGMLEASGMQLHGQFLILKGMDRAIRLNIHRPLPADAKIKGATFTLHGKHWFVSLQVESTEITADQAPTGAVIGLDVGVEHLATWSDGAVDGHIPNVRPRSRREREIRCAYKAERAGSAVVEARAAGTSQLLCIGCGAKVPKTLSVRRHSCACGLELQRDINAARVILSRGLPAEGVQPLGKHNVADHGVRAARTLLAA